MNVSPHRPAVPPKPERDKLMTDAGGAGADGSGPGTRLVSTETQVNLMVLRRGASPGTGTSSCVANGNTSDPVPGPKPALPPKPKTAPKPVGISTTSGKENQVKDAVSSPPPKASTLISKFNLNSNNVTNVSRTTQASGSVVKTEVVRPSEIFKPTQVLHQRSPEVPPKKPALTKSPAVAQKPSPVSPCSKALPSVPPKRPSQLPVWPLPKQGLSPTAVAAAQKKTVSLGRNIAPPPANFGKFSRVAPLDLSVSSSQPKVGNVRSPVSPPPITPFSIRSRFPSEAVVRRVPPPNEELRSGPPQPPPRHRKSSRLSASSPTEPQPHQVVFPTLSQDSESNKNLLTPVYAVVDLEAKWAARQQRLSTSLPEPDEAPDQNQLVDDTIQVTEGLADAGSEEDVFGEVNEGLMAVVNAVLTVSPCQGQSAAGDSSISSLTVVENESRLLNKRVERETSPLDKVNELKLYADASAVNIESNLKMENKQPEATVLEPVKSALFSLPQVNHEGAESIIASAETPTNVEPNNNCGDELDKSELSTNSSFLFQESRVDENAAVEKKATREYLPSPEVEASIPDIFETELEKIIDHPSQILRTDTFMNPEFDPREKYSNHRNSNAFKPSITVELIADADRKVAAVRDLLASLSTVDTVSSVLVHDVQSRPANLTNELSPTDVHISSKQDDSDDDELADTNGDLKGSLSRTPQGSSSYHRRSYPPYADSSPCLSESSSTSSGHAINTKGNRSKDRSSWAEIENEEAGALGDAESSDALAPSSNEDIQYSTLMRTKHRLSRLFSRKSSSQSPSTPAGKEIRADKPPVSCPRISVDDSERYSTASVDSAVSSFSRDSAPRVSLLSQASLDSAFASRSSGYVDENIDDDCKVEAVSQPNSLTPVPMVAPKPKPYEDILEQLPEEEKKVFRAAREMLTSEQTFVDVLKLLTIEFPEFFSKASQETKTTLISDADLKFIQGDLSVYKGFNISLLDALDKRLAQWQQIPKVADIFLTYGPFFKNYSAYIRDFEKINQRVDECCKNVQFAHTLKAFESQQICQKLGLKHYLLKPVQRMPQYKLLLENYLQAIEKSNLREDHENTIKAIKVVTDVASHANTTIDMQSNFQQLLALQARLPDQNIIQLHRKFIREGELLKMCRKGPQPRYFALMTDVLLCMTYNAATGASNTKELRIGYELPLTGMIITTPLSEDMQTEFSIRSEQRSFSLQAKSQRERDSWVKVITEAIQEQTSRMLKSTNESESTKSVHHEVGLGSIAPVWVTDTRVTMCQACHEVFTMTFRRHHCRACGKVVCTYCSGNKAPLKYKKNEAKRVCDDCYSALLDDFDRIHSEDDRVLDIRNRFKQSGTLQRRQRLKSVPDKLKKDGMQDIIWSGFLHSREKRWKRRWFVLRDDQVLYAYAAPEDTVAKGTFPVVGYKVEAVPSEDLEANQLYAFHLSHENQQYSMKLFADSETARDRWVAFLKEAQILS